MYTLVYPRHIARRLRQMTLLVSFICSELSLVMLKAAFVLACFHTKDLDLESDTEYQQIFVP